MSYSFCEGAWASSTSKWHIRKLSRKGQKFGGGADTLSFCGRKMAWDLEADISGFHLEKNTCETCANQYLKEEKK